MQHNIVIHMGASVFEARVRTPDGNNHYYDLGRMTKQQEHEFRRTLVRAWREATHEGN